MTNKKHFRGGCPSCAVTEDFLSMDTVLYQDFGGYIVLKNGKLFYCAESINSEEDWLKVKTLADIEKDAAKEPDAKWEIKLDLPLRGGVWSRNKKGQWKLKSSNMGFA